jgi:hypothetical protein
VVRMPGTWAAELAANAHPLRWSTAVPDFFLKSSPAKRDEVGWYETTGWDSNEGGYLYEVTHWDWNESMSAEVHNILEITNVSTAGGISYDYSLRECLRSNMGVTWEQGGLDVDEGFYRLRISEPSAYRPGTKTALKPEQIAWNQGDVVVTISSEKSVRYTPPNVSPAEIGAILNLMAPATVSMLMRRLVLDSVDPPASAPIASAPIASAPTAAA